jgi:hypothetical protein
MLAIHEGNWPAVVNRDAKYHVKHRGKYVVELQYRTAEGEKWCMTTTLHDALVEMVNAVKNEANGSPGGVFYVNEYRQVIVPAGNPTIYYYAGDYHGHLEFYFEEHRISGKPTRVDGQPLAPGSRWEGPHVGIPYKLKAGGRDIAYVRRVRTNVTQEERLSRYAGDTQAARLANKLARIIGHNGGRFYINEFKHMFKPIQQGTDLEYTYVGILEDDDPWFPRLQPKTD